MRPLILLRFLAALLACTAALSSPAVALAHGVTHAQESRTDGHAHVADLGTAGGHADALVSAADATSASDSPHLGLHADCQARAGSNLAVALAAVPVVLPALVSVPCARSVAPLDDWVQRPSCASPPDLPRAPPVG
jgi:hypothetical protein